MENKDGISCIAVGDMLKKRLEEYTEALSGGADIATLARMEDEIDKIEAVHDKCVDMGNVTDIGTSHADESSNVVDDAEGGDNNDYTADDAVDSIDDWSKRVFEEEEGN